MRSLNRKDFISSKAQAIPELAPLRILQQATKPGPSEKEGRANRTVKEAKTVSAEHLAVRKIRRRIGWVLAASHVPHAPTRHMTSVCPQASHGNNPPVCLMQ